MMIQATNRCCVCLQQAYGMNYGIISCNACKMFFRRVICQNLKYRCRKNGECYKNIDIRFDRPECKSCRFKKCQESGMVFPNNEVPTILKTCTDSLANLLASLLELDYRRIQNLENLRSTEDPTIGELIGRSVRGFSVGNSVDFSLQAPNDQVLSQWSFFGIWSSVEFLNNLDFMSQLENPDKIILLKSFAMNSYLLSTAFQSLGRNSAQLLNPDGTEVYTSRIKEMPEFSPIFTDRIQKLLVGKLADLKITPHEYMLTSVLLFCTPRLSGLSNFGQQIVNEQQRKYCNALFEHCKLTSHSAPTRFQEIMSIGNILTKCFEDVQYLATMLQIFHPTWFNYKKLLMESLNK